MGVCEVAVVPKYICCVCWSSPGWDIASSPHCLHGEDGLQLYEVPGFFYVKILQWCLCAVTYSLFKLVPLRFGGLQNKIYLASKLTVPKWNPVLCSHGFWVSTAQKGEEEHKWGLVNQRGKDKMLLLKMRGVSLKNLEKLMSEFRKKIFYLTKIKLLLKC